MFKIRPLPIRAVTFPLLFLCVAIGVMAYFLYVAAQRENVLARNSSLHLTNTAFKSVTRTTSNWVKDYAWWDETLAQTTGEVDVKWAEGNVGTYLQETFGITGSFIVNPTLQTTFFSPSDDNRHNDAMKFLDDQGQKFLDLVQHTSMAESTALSTYVKKDGKVYLVAAAPITAEEPSAEDLNYHPRAILILYQHLNQDLIENLATNFLLKDLTVSDLLPNEIADFIPLNDFSGQPIAFAFWQAPRPGDTLIFDLLPRIAVATALMFLGAFLVFANWLRSASEANDAKTVFLAKMSHELRTPLNPIMGFSQLMARETSGPLPQSYKTHVNHIYNNSKLLLSIIEDILDVSRLETRKMELHETVFDVCPMISELPNPTDLLSLGMATQEDKSPIQLHHDFEDGLPMLRADELRVHQILLNLLTNAVKYSIGDEIRISVRLVNGCITIIVEDNGIGIAKEDLKSLFSPFVQLENTRVRGTSTGTGLGLVISRELMSLHDGTLVLESEPGAGTKAIMTFPSSRSVST
jgi:signal transduction histidine kinase